MEFEATISGKLYRLTSLNKHNILVSGFQEEYILYNSNGHWDCADDIRDDLLTQLGRAIDQHLQLA